VTLPMTLGNMRANGVHTLAVWCCGRGWSHQSVLDVSGYIDDLPMPAFSPRMVCTVCGAIGADARPNSNEKNQQKPITRASSAPQLVHSCPIADKLMRCRECPLRAKMRHCLATSCAYRRSYSGSPALRKPSSYLARSSTRRIGIQSLTSDTRIAGSTSRKCVITFCASACRPANSLAAAK
jgi:hypothetical protein